MSAQEVREEIFYLINNYGTTLAFLSKEAELAKETISRFKTGKQELAEDALNKLDTAIKRIRER